MLVWVYPHPQYPERSIIKKLDLNQALFVNENARQQSEPAGESDEQETSGEGTASGTINGAGHDSEPETGDDAEHGLDERTPVEQAEEETVQPAVIDPNGFAIYPQTNGEVIAWLDNLDPSRARLLMTRDDGRTIIAVAEGVGRLFGVGDRFIVYTQNDAIMLYFWESECYARLTGPGHKGMLSKACVTDNAVVWCNADNPNQVGDIIYVSIVEQP